MHYCAPHASDGLTSSALVQLVAATFLFHVVGLPFLERYCSVVPPPGTTKRPAVYLLRIAVGATSGCLLIPVAMRVVFSNAAIAAKNLMTHIFSPGIQKEGGSILRVFVSNKDSSWACRAETTSALMHLVNISFEVSAFKLKQKSAVLLHHFASMLYLAARLSPTSFPLGSAPDWLWLALSWHLTVYSLNMVRHCNSFAKHYLGDSFAKPHLSVSMDALYNSANLIVWVLTLSGYLLAAMTAFISPEESLQDGLLCLAVAAPLSVFSVIEILRAKIYTQPIGHSHCATLFILIREVAIGLFVAPVLVLLDYLFPGGMKTFTKKGSHKNTAGGVVALRALCHSSSDPRLHIEDPFAIRFVESRLARAIATSSVLQHLMCRKLERQHPGALGHLITRTKTIDEAIEHLTNKEDGLQLVLLGAGYDTRAYRLKTLRDVAVFEVDQHFMSCEKQKKCACFKPVCKELVHLSADFNAQSVADILYSCEQYNPALPTLFVWEGVTVYLSSDSVNSMFYGLREMSLRAPGSTQYLYFTFSDKALLTPKGRRRLYGGKEFYEYASGIGEEVRSGLDPRGLEKDLLAWGFVPYECDGHRGYSGHMTPRMMQLRYLARHPFVRESEVFHSALVRNALVGPVPGEQGTIFVEENKGGSVVGP